MGLYRCGKHAGFVSLNDYAITKFAQKYTHVRSMVRRNPCVCQLLVMYKINQNNYSSGNDSSGSKKRLGQSIYNSTSVHGFILLSSDYINKKRAHI